MNLTGYVEALRQQLAVAAAAGGDEAQALAERLIAPLDAATRLVLLDALSAAAGEITLEMAPGSVDLRLRDREPTFVVTLPPSADASIEDAIEAPAAAPTPTPTSAPTPVTAPTSGPETDESAMVRINLRLPEHLKGRVEEAAARAGLSVNAWLVRAATSALDGGIDPGDQGRPAKSDWRSARGGQRYTGWVR